MKPKALFCSSAFSILDESIGTIRNVVSSDAVCENTMVNASCLNIIAIMLSMNSIGT